MAEADAESSGTRRVWHWPMRWRLPVLICGLLLGSVTVFGWTAYREVERALLEGAHGRLQNVGRQLSGLLVQSTQPRLEESRRLAARPAFGALLHSPDAATRAAATAELDAFLKTSPQTIGVEIWNAAGEQVIDRTQAASASAGRTAAAPAPSAAALTPRAPTGTGFGALEATKDAVYYDVVADIPAPSAGASSASAAASTNGRAESPGRLVVRRRLTSSGTAAAVAGLIGGGVSVTIGSKDSGVWTDLTSLVPAPPAGGDQGVVTEYIAPNGEQHLGHATPITNTPWTMWVAIPRSLALATANVFFGRMIPLAIFVVVFGSAIAWGTTRRITRPLESLTGAAAAIAGGDLSRRVDVRRHDELGRLGAAFNTMAAHIEDSHHELDRRVAERTHDLEGAMTRLQETQQELVRREKLAMLGQLASGVGHELRNPLGVMTNAVYFLEMVQPDAPEPVKEYHGLLRAQIGLSEKIVSDLLDFARIKPPRREAMPLMRLVEDQLARVSIADGVHVVKNVPDDLPPAYIDSVQMGQVLLNLLVNAIQAMEEHGGLLTVRGGQEGDRVRLDVIDTGPGVKAELREKIFEALFTTKARGIGLGLAVSRSLVEANGGTLTLGPSAPGQGATFTLLLPAVFEGREPGR